MFTLWPKALLQYFTQWGQVSKCVTHKYVGLLHSEHCLVPSPVGNIKDIYQFLSVSVSKYPSFTCVLQSKLNISNFLCSNLNLLCVRHEFSKEKLQSPYKNQQNCTDTIHSSLQLNRRIYQSFSSAAGHEMCPTFRPEIMYTFIGNSPKSLIVPHSAHTSHCRDQTFRWRNKKRKGF